MSRLMVQHQRMPRGKTVQLLQGQGQISQPPAGDPLAGGYRLCKIPDSLPNLLHGLRSFQLRLQLGGGQLGKVAVGVDQPGNQGPALQIHLPAVSCPFPQPGQISHRFNGFSIDQQGLGLLRLRQGHNFSAVKQNFHIFSS